MHQSTTSKSRHGWFQDSSEHDSPQAESYFYQGRGPASLKNPPVGPSSSSVASSITILAPSCTVRVPLNPFRSVAMKPGMAVLILICGLVSVRLNAFAYCIVRIGTAALYDALA